jgi:hypothetical protein
MNQSKNNAGCKEPKPGTMVLRPCEEGDITSFIDANKVCYKVIDCSSWTRIKVCRFEVYAKHGVDHKTYKMCVDGQTVGGLDSLNVEYFKSHYKKLGYEIEG